ncbi:Arrestin_N terminal like, putative [Leishmania guyanensis]|uniref:Arrestin-like N-terminal domain-containing protein n=1 Tax=Leishmania guyanensis TaxID=5670 RepID=A0A1E1J8R8_LEIGU|nr:hypothetical protein, conserved [Leishmania guyanensis]
MFRKRRSSKEMAPEVLLLLRHPSRYPGDLLQGVVIVDIPFPSDILALEVRICGDENSILGGLIMPDKNPEARNTIYYDQFITLRGIDHDLLEMKRSLQDSRRTPVSRGAVARESIWLPDEAQGLRTGLNGTLCLPSSSTGDEVPEFAASMVHDASGATVHLIPGIYSYPFSLVLPDNLPASRELSRGSDGRCVLQYRAIASLIMTSGKIHTSVTGFRVNPLPVQVQRWYQLHGAEQQLCGDAVDGSTANGNEADSRPGVMSRLMSSAGTVRASKAKEDRENVHQRRLHHYLQFSEDQLALESAVYAEAAGRRAKEKKHRMRERNARENGSLLMAAETKTVTKKGTSRKLRSQQELEEVEKRSLDSTDDAVSAANVLDYDANDEIYAFGPDVCSPTVAESINGEEEDGNVSVHHSKEETSVARSSVLEVRGERRKWRHHGGENDAINSPTHTAMVKSNVVTLTCTPSEKDFPTHLEVRHANRTEVVLREAAGGSNVEERKGRRSRNTKLHRRRRRFQPPPWNQEFFINLRSGFLRTGKVRVVLSLRSPLVTVGVGKVGASVLIDNSDGTGAISRVKYSLVTRCYIRSKAEVYNFQVNTVETNCDVAVEKGSVLQLPEVELPVSKSTPLTILTEGMGTLTFLSVRLYVNTTLKTFSRSVATEVVLVSGQDILNCSRRLLRWSCFFRRRRGEDARDITVHPPTINLSEKNSKLHIMYTGNRGATEDPDGFLLQSNDTDMSLMAPAAVSRSMRILRRSQRISQATPPIDTRVLTRALNYEEAVFVPHDDDDVMGFPKHMDPIAGLNPFAAPACDGKSTLTAGDSDKTLCGEVLPAS